MVNVSNTDRLGDTDIHIRNLAFELDSLLGSGLVFATFAGYIAPVGGVVVVPFPLSQVIGAIIQGANTKGYGDPMYANPVPPASIGALLPQTNYSVYIQSMNSPPGSVSCLLRTTTVQTTSGSNNVGWGSRPSTSGTVSGLAWGRA